jgi:hypothetical protein
MSDVPFITADQPAINLCAGPKDFSHPTKFEICYPLSPSKAMLLLETSSDNHPGDPSVSATYVHLCNLGMAAHSYRQMFSSTPEELQHVRQELPGFLGCF